MHPEAAEAAAVGARSERQLEGPGEHSCGRRVAAPGWPQRANKAPTRRRTPKVRPNRTLSNGLLDKLRLKMPFEVSALQPRRAPAISWRAQVEPRFKRPLRLVLLATLVYLTSDLADSSSGPLDQRARQQVSILTRSDPAQTSASSSSSPSVSQLWLGSNLAPRRQKRDSASAIRQQHDDSSRRAAAAADQIAVCQVNDGESVAIVEIEESRGSDMSQMTKPNELPISGSVEANEIELKIESETHKYFKIQNKSLLLIRPLDRDAVLKENSTQVLQQAITSIYLQISCLDRRLPRSNGAPPQVAKKVIIPVLVKVLDLNDQAPKFAQSQYSVQVNELAPVGTVVLDQIAYAIDLDSANNGQLEYSLLGQKEASLAGSLSTAAATSQPSAVTPMSWQDRMGAKQQQSVGQNQRLIQRTPQLVVTTPTTTSTTVASVASSASSAAATAAASAITSSADESSSGPGSLASIETSPPASKQTLEGVQQVQANESTTFADTSESSRSSSSDTSDTTSRLKTTELPPVGAGTSNQSETRLELNSTDGQHQRVTPTINLNSEPILNGPMEEMDEDESDEALLASMNLNSTDSDQDQPEQPDLLGGLVKLANEEATSGSSLAARESDGAHLVGPHSDGASVSNNQKRERRRRRRKRRHLNQAAATATTTTTTAATTTNLSADSKLKKLPLTTQASKVVEAATQNPPWTNLMVVMPSSSDDFQPAERGRMFQAQEKEQKLQLLQNQQQRQPADELAEQRDDDDDALEYFELELAPQTGRPVIRLKKQLDFERKRVHKLTLVATDRAANKLERLSSRAQIVIRVLDGDDQPPAFVLDQVGCATNSLPHFTTPSSLQFGATASSEDPPSVSRPSSQWGADLLQIESSAGKRVKAPRAWQAGGDTLPATSAQQLRAFRLTDENFDFGDTLALDDTPLDENETAAAAAAAASAGQQLEASGRARRVSPAEQQAPLAELASVGRQVQASHHSGAKLRHNDAMSDYLCLSSAGANLEANSSRMEQTIEYFATVISGDSDYLLRVAPQSIKARDRDELNAPIRYSFINGTPANYNQYFRINPLDATVKQIEPVERSQVSEFVLFVRAEEQTYNKLSSVAKLIVDVLPTDKSPPVLMPNSYSGFVDENSPIGTRVLIWQPQNSTKTHMRISVLDVDNGRGSVPLPASTSTSTSTSNSNSTSSTNQQTGYHFETTSDAFKVDRDGFVYVNRFPLDRDGPNQAVHMFQVTARQAGLVSARSLSSPISLNISLLDLNDNAPLLLNSSLAPIQMAANSRGGAHFLTQIFASDRDAPENSRQQFSILHVSNGGGARFRIDQESGRIEALGKFQAGEQFSLTLQVADELQRVSQGILEVQVIPGANSGGPQFLVEGGELGDNSRGYSIEINEAIAPNSVVLQVRALDPDNDPISYSLIGGNTNGDFSVNSRTGALQVIKRLDREEISAYKLIVQARDSGGLATSRPIHVTIGDSNDQNPVFNQARYVFAVEEGAGSVGQLLGRVSAQDGDEGENGRVSYSLLSLKPAYSEQDDEATTNSNSSQLSSKTAHDNLGGASASASASAPFAIDEKTGDIRLLEPLDYEQAHSHALLVMARDNGEDPRLSSASVLIKVLDKQDELPYFERFHLECKLDENLANHRVALVQARDPDSVAQISYVLLAGDSALFQVDAQTGLVTTTSAGLDYERARSHTLLVGTNESLAAGLELASVALKLNEHIDELQKQPQQPQQAQHQHFKGNAHASQPLERWPIVRVDVHVQDLNDEAPQFESPHPLPVRIQDSAPLGTVLAARLQARDRDGSQANSQVRYELVVGAPSSSAFHPAEQALVTSAKCARLFLVDPTSGQISVRADLKQDSLSECQLVVRAYDLASGQRDGQTHDQSLGASPTSTATSLSSTSVLTVFIDHLAEISAASMISFADTSYTVELAENAPPNTLVKLLPVLNKPKVAFPMSCELMSGNELAKFQIVENEQRDCELRTRDHSIDFESRQRYNLVVKLNTIGSSPGSRATLAQIQVNILDQNDNRPAFSVPARYGQLTQGRFLAAIASDSPSETQVLQVRATDADSAQANGLVTYELLSEPELEARFKVDPIDGIIRTSRPVEDLPNTRLPVRLRLLARDNPEQTGESPALDSVAEIVLNLIDERHRLALVLKDTPAGRVLDNKEQLLRILQERTGLIAGLERVESLKIQRNATPIVEADVSGADVWFHLIEPGSLRIVASDDARLKSALFEARAQNSLADVINQSLGFAKARIRLPYSLVYALHSAAPNGHAFSSPADLLFGTFRAHSSDRLAPVLILVALFIGLASAIVLVYQCGSAAGWSESNQSNSSHLATAGAHFGKEKFLFSPPPPPPGASFRSALDGSQLEHQNNLYANSRSSFNVSAAAAAAAAVGATSLPGQQHQPLDQETLYQLGAAAAAAAAQAKEYETQMLKMSVLFDDNQSFEEHNLHELSVAKNLV